MNEKIFNKKNLLLSIGFALLMSLLISVGTFSSAFAVDNNTSNESHHGKAGDLDQYQVRLDVQRPAFREPYNGAIGGVQDTHGYYWDEDNGIKCPRLFITEDDFGSGSTLAVHYTSWCPGCFTDVDYRFTVVAMTHDGEIQARFRASGDDSVSDEPCTEEIWQRDCIWGDKSIAHDPMRYNGVFYVEKIEVDD